MNDYNNVLQIVACVLSDLYLSSKSISSLSQRDSLCLWMYNIKACWFCAYVLLCQIINVGRPLKSFGSIVLNIQWPNATKEGKRLLYLVQIKDRRNNIIHCTPAEAINPLRFIKVVPSWDMKWNNDHLLTSAVTGSILQLSVLDICKIPSGIAGEVPNVSYAHSLGII